MKVDNKILLVIVSISFIVSAIMIVYGFKLLAKSIDDKAIGSYFNAPSTITTIDINTKDFLTDYEAAQYLGISWEALITLVNNGTYKGSYAKEIFNELNTIYIFPREELKSWFSDYIKTNKVIHSDSSYLPSKE